MPRLNDTTESGNEITLRPPRSWRPFKLSVRGLRPAARSRALKLKHGLYRKSLAGALVLALLTLCSCGNQAEGSALATAGSSAATTLANYYNSLVQDIVDTWEMEAFYDSLQGIPFSNESQKNYQDRINSLNHRAQMAADLGSIYGALSKLSSYDTTQVGDAASRLSQQVTQIPAIAGSGIDPSKIVGMIASDLASWVQSRDLKKGSVVIIKVLESVEMLFRSESRMYESIALDRGSIASRVIDYMIQKNMVSTTPLLESIPQTLGLTLTSVPSDEQTTKAVIQLANVRARRVALLSAAAANTMDQALLALIRSHQDFQNKKLLTLANVLGGLQRAQSYLDEISKLKAEINPPKKN
jgi:hypothetical protein